QRVAERSADLRDHAFRVQFPGAVKSHRRLLPVAEVEVTQAAVKDHVRLLAVRQAPQELLELARVAIAVEEVRGQVGIELARAHLRQLTPAASRRSGTHNSAASVYRHGSGDSESLS